MQGLRATIKKIGALASGALMMGATLGMAAAYDLSQFPSPFVSNGNVTAQIIVGSAAKTADVVGGIQIAERLGNLAIKSEEKTATTGVSGTSVSVSNGVSLDTANTKIYYGDSLTKSGLKNTLTDSDLPTILKSGTVTVSGGTAAGNYNYDQYITMKGGTVSFGKSSGDFKDPELYIATGSDTSSPLYNLSVVFNKLLNISDSDVRGSEIELFGNTYTIGSTSDFTASTKKLVLYGAGTIETIKKGETITVTLNGVEHTIGVESVSSASVAAINVDGTLKSMTVSNSYTIGDVTVYVNDIFYDPKETGVSSVKLNIGSQKITLEDGSAVTTGIGDNAVDGTLVYLTGTAGTGISKLTVAVTATGSDKDYIKKDGSFVDPVFGTFKIAFGGLATGTTDTIEVDNSGTTGATLKFTDYRGNEKQITWVKSPSGSFAPQLNWTSTAKFHVVEGETVKVGDYILLTPTQGSEFGHILKYTTASSIGSSGAYISLNDVMSGDTHKIYLTDSGYASGTFYLDGQAYYVKNVSSADKTFSFTWGSGASAGSAGDKTTVYPLIKAKGGEWVTLTTNVSLTNGTTYELPTNTSFTYLVGTNNGTTPQYGRVEYSISSGGTLTLADGSGNPFVYPAVLVLEEKAKDTSNTEVQDAIIVSVYDGSASGTDVSIGKSSSTGPIMTAATKTTTDNTQETDSSITEYYDRRGTYVKYDSDNQGYVEIVYPDEQAIAAVGVGSDPTITIGEGTTEVTYTESTPGELPATAARLDSEVTSSMKLDANTPFILVGGPAINDLVAELAAEEGSPVWNLETWRDGAHNNMAQIVLVNDAFVEGKVALVVAGHSADDTRAASKAVANYDTGIFDEKATEGVTEITLTSAEYPS